MAESESKHFLPVDDECTTSHCHRKGGHRGCSYGPYLPNLGPGGVCNICGEPWPVTEWLNLQMLAVAARRADARYSNGYGFADGMAANYAAEDLAKAATFGPVLALFDRIATLESAIRDMLRSIEYEVWPNAFHRARVTLRVGEINRRGEGDKG